MVGSRENKSKETFLQKPHVMRALRTVSYVLLLKSAVGCAFAVLTLCGVTFPFFGIEFTPARETAAAGLGGILGFITALRA